MNAGDRGFKFQPSGADAVAGAVDKMQRGEQTRSDAAGYGARAIRCVTVALAAIVIAVCGIRPASAQFTAPTDPGTGNVHLSGASSLFDLSTRFLRHLGTEASSATAGPPLVNNPQGGGGDAQMPERYRAWFEGYGLASKMSGQADFPGDQRKTWGGVAGLGLTAAPGVSFGASVDQSRTKIDVIGLPQSATIDLTQVGANAAFESGPWTLGVAAIHGFGSVSSQRDDVGAFVDSTSYSARLWGAFGELSYLWAMGDARLVPKIGADWARTETGSFTETGGPSAVSGTGQVSSRTRIFAGAEIGRTWTLGTAMLDLSGYGRAVDIVDQNIGALQVSGPGGPVSLQGIAESRLGADAGAAATLRLSAAMRLYAAYDGRFRSNFTSHSGTLGLELRW